MGLTMLNPPQAASRPAPAFAAAPTNAASHDATQAAPKAAADAERRELLTFRLAEESYGIDILKVQEIRGYETPTRIANAPAHVRGVINLRGIIVPIVDMRARFGLPESTQAEPSVVIIVNVGAKVAGIVVDSVSDVVALGADQVHPAPAVSAIDDTYITGLGTLEGRMLILLDVQGVVRGIEAA